MAKTPFILITGFLGSGKTTLLKKFLASHAQSKRILLVENEFSNADVDGKDLKQQGFNFTLLEINNGSVFCACLFLDFVRVLSEQIEIQKPDVVLLEATGIADPIAIAQLINNPMLGKRIYLAHIWDIVDASNLLKMKDVVRCISNQVRVADTVIVNKCDLIDKVIMDKIDDYLISINPFAKIIHSSFCSDVDFSIPFSEGTNVRPVVEQEAIVGPLTKCNEREMNSYTFKTVKPVTLEKLNQFLDRIPENIYRLKGFVHLSDGNNVVLQYTAGQTQVEPVNDTFIFTTELIAIGTGNVCISI